MSPTRTLLSKLINSLSFCLTTSVNSAYLNKCHKCKPNKFHTFLIRQMEKYKFSSNWGYLEKVSYGDN